MDLSSKIEALLFFRGEPTSIKKLAEILAESPEKIALGLRALEESLQGRGICLITKDDEVSLGTAAVHGPLIEQIIKDELHKDLGRAGLETLSIVIYLGPVSRSQIDYIRGVSSTFILRNLLIRGLVERVDNPGDKRSFLYKPTFELLSYLGVKNVEELPEYASVKAELDAKQQAAEAALKDPEEMNDENQ